ncbi:DUF5681 domain-containing protein [Cysteiniphilum sp. 6C5]|uniref:DUF5681 domain-containing protein n=1 Tax=unclassified Cysteiniphilum TaxID=2610889 RepID=UPI003F8706B6
MPFQKGISGNPKGRPKGSGWNQKLTARVLSDFTENDVTKQLRVLYELGISGDIQAIKIFLSYFLCTADKQVEVEQEKTELTDDQALAIRDIVAQGENYKHPLNI